MMVINYKIKASHKAAGFSLIELIIAIVIISVSIAGMMAAYSSIVSRSADPLIYQQAIEIANSYMEEVAGKDFPAAPGTCTGGLAANRPNFDDICDYNGYAEAGVSDIAGTDAGLDEYGVLIAVEAKGTDLPGLAANDAVRIDVTVSHPLGSAITLSTYRVDY